MQTIGMSTSMARGSENIERKTPIWVRQWEVLLPALDFDVVILNGTKVREEQKVCAES